MESSTEPSWSLGRRERRGGGGEGRIGEGRRRGGEEGGREGKGEEEAQ